MGKRGAVPAVRILLVDDHKDWREKIRLLFQERPEWQIISEASDRSEAVQKAGELEPDVVLLDTGLPKLNGIEAAQQIRQHSPNSKIVFLSPEKSLDFVQEAFKHRRPGLRLQGKRRG